MIATANVPDLNTGFVPNAYNPARGALGQFIIPGTRNNGPCPATLCPHFRTYNGNTNAVDVTLTSIAVGSNVFDILTSQDGNAVWTIIPSQVAGFILTQYSSGFVEGLSLTSSAGSSMHSLATDGAFVYTILNSSGIEFLRRVRLSTFVSEDVNIFGGTISQILLQKDGFLYVGQTGSLQKVRLSDRTIVATLSLQGVETPLIAGSEYDVVNNRFYVTSTTSGTSMTVRRVNLDSFVSEQFINIVLTPSNYSTGYDFAHQAMYESNAGVNVALQKVTLCS